MELLNHADAAVIESDLSKYQGYANEALKVGTPLAKGVVASAKSKSAQQAADAGSYWTLRPYLKSLIDIPAYIKDQVANQGINTYAVLQLPAQGTGSSNTQIITDLKALSKAPNMTGVTGLAAAPSSLAEITSATNAIAMDASGAVTGGTMAGLKTMLPYIIGLAVIGVLIYFIAKKK